MNYRDRYTEHAPRRSDPQGSLSRHVGGPSMTEGEILARAEAAYRGGVIVFTRKMLEQMPTMMRLTIEGAARQIYERR